MLRAISLDDSVRRLTSTLNAEKVVTLRSTAPSFAVGVGLTVGLAVGVGVGFPFGFGVGVGVGRSWRWCRSWTWRGIDRDRRLRAILTLHPARVSHRE